MPEVRINVHVPKYVLDDAYNDVYQSVSVLERIIGDPGIGPASRIVIEQQTASLKDAAEKLYSATQSD